MDPKEKKDTEVKNDKELLLQEIKELIADSQRENVSVKDLNDRVEAINKSIAEKLDNAGIATLKKSVDDILAATAASAAAIKAMNETAGKKDAEKPMTFKDALIASIMDKAKDVPGLLSDKNDDYGQRKSLKDYFTSKGNHSSPEFVINKTLVDMLESSIVGSNAATVKLTELDPQRVGIPLTLYPHVVDWMPSKTITKPYMSLLVVYEYEDGAATKTEGSASVKSSFKLKTVEFKSFFIATFFTLSDETLDDLNEAMEELSIVAPSKILDKVDGYVLGTAGDDSTAIGGMLSGSVSKHTDFTGSTTYADYIPNANEIDVIATMKLQAEASNYLPDVVLMTASDINKLAGKKDQLDNSINDRRVVYNNIGEPAMACGMRILKQTGTALTAGRVIVADSKQFMLGKRKEMTMEIGHNAADLTEGQKTVVIKVRLAFGVRDPLAVIYCSDLDQAVTDITVE